MSKNTYKSAKKRGLFAYLEQKLQLKGSLAQALPEHYLPRILFLFVIGILYVGNTHYHEKMVRKISQLTHEVDALKVDYTTLKADYMFDSKQSEIAKRAAKLGLAVPLSPPLKIKQ